MWKVVSVNVALVFAISVMPLPLLGQSDLVLPDDSQELMQKLSFHMKGVWHDTGQVILAHSKICHGCFVSFSVTHSFRAKNVPICNSKGSLPPRSPAPIPWQELPTLACVWELRSVVISQMRSFHCQMCHFLLKCSTVPTSWLLCNAWYAFPTGARAQQLYDSNRDNFNVCCTFILWTTKHLIVPAELSSPTTAAQAYSEP